MSMKVVTSAFHIRPETAVSAASVERLYDRVFGPTRYRKASHRFRTGLSPIAELSWIAREGTSTVGAVRCWPIRVGATGEAALLLGPLAVAPDRRARGIGRALVRKTLAVAAEAGHDLVMLVGDRDYYERFGFVPATSYGFVMPGETQPERLQAISLQGRFLRRADGVMHRALDPDVGAVSQRIAPQSLAS
jgi:predicted N-acetyltransferase YhbS